MISRTFFLILSLAGIAFVTGCSPYVEDFHYVPHPAVAEVSVATTQPSQPAPPPAVTTYATIVGIRRANEGQHIPLSVEVRLRFDNHEANPVEFNPQSLDLTTGDLVRFPPPLVTPQPVSLPPGSPVMVQANFPFPPGLSYDNLNLQTLQLRWAVEMDSHPVAQSADFRRVYRYYDDPYWYGPAYGYPYGYPYYGPVFGARVVIRR